MIVYVMVRLGVDVGNLGAISSQSRRDPGTRLCVSGVCDAQAGGSLCSMVVVWVLGECWEGVSSVGVGI